MKGHNFECKVHFYCWPPTSTALVLLEIAPQISFGNLSSSPLSYVYQVEVTLVRLLG